MTHVALASMVGTALEWYDFMIYNTMSALVFGPLFFPTSSPMVGTLMAFSTYAVGYISRPLGGMIFGQMGDRIGRRAVLTITLLLMGICTGLIALLPSYRTAGLAAPAILVLLRFLQGIALGGEWAGAVLLGVEHGSADRRGLNASWAQMGPGAGTLASSAVIASIAALTSGTQFIAWGWRIPFALSGVLAVIGLWLRSGVPETRTFETMRQSGQTLRSPIRHLLRRHGRSLVIAALSRIGPDVLYALLVVFSLTYVTQIVGQSRVVVLTALLVGSAFSLPATIGFALLADWVGVRAVYLGGLLAAVPFACLFFPVVRTGQEAAIIATIAAGLVIHASMYAVQGAFITACFPAEIRYSGSSISYTFGSLAGGGAFAPLIMAALYRSTGSAVALSFYVVVATVITALGLLSARGVAKQE
ncbi:major facilitator superfamily transporter [Gluconacetobacter johannae DSM 13595]|nr:MFS transporter [Gluconacetobacter johannae]GBQ87493.1 major facilitator superfamily transporter [Gluconacetobacter johannae DSM 13595]